jgi:hypothetical protein
MISAATAPPKTAAERIAQPRSASNLKVGTGVLHVTPSPQKGLQVAERFRHYDDQIRVHGGNPPYEFRIISGQLPPDFVLSENGAIHGMPDKPGFYTFIVRIKDSKQQIQDVQYTIHVRNEGRRK